MSLPFKNKYLHSSIQTRLTVTIMDSYILQHSPMISLKPQQSEKYPRHRLTSPQPDSLQPPNPFSDLLCSISNPQNRHRTWQKLHCVYQKRKLPLALPRPRSRLKPRKRLEFLVKKKKPRTHTPPRHYLASFPIPRNVKCDPKRVYPS